VDAVEGRRIYGWAWDRANPSERLRIEIRDAEKVVAAVTADRPRPDLKANGIGDGLYAFEASLGEEPLAGDTLAAVAISPSTGQRVTLARRAPSPRSAAAAAAPAAVPAQDIVNGAQRRAVAAMQAAERKFDDAAARLMRAPEMTQALEEIRVAQRDLARRIGEAEVFLVRFDGVLNTLERLGKQQAPNTTINRQTLLIVGLAMLATAATVAAVLLAFAFG